MPNELWLKYSLGSVRLQLQQGRDRGEEGDWAPKKSKAALDGQATKLVASLAVCPAARLFAAAELGKLAALSHIAITLKKAVFPLFFRDPNLSDAFQFCLVSGLVILHTTTTTTTTDSKCEGKGIGSSETLLLAWGLQLCWEAAPAQGPSLSRGRCPQTAPIPLHQRTGHWRLQGCRGQPSSSPPTPQHPGCCHCSRPPCPPAQHHGAWGQGAHPQGHPCQRLTPQPRGNVHT